MDDIPIYRGKRKNILVLSGGGVKGLAVLGTLKKLMELEILNTPDIYCGTSVGGVICFLLMIGYTPENIFEITSSLDYTLLVDYNDNLLEESTVGMMTSDPFILIIKTMLTKKNFSSKITFKELYNIIKKKLIITGVCLNNLSITYFSHETTPDTPILIALRITMSIPFIFKPVYYDNKLWIDGACLNNYPIDIFDDKLEDVIGIYMEDEDKFIEDFEDKISYSLQIIKCIFKSMNYQKKKTYDKYTLLLKLDFEGSLFEMDIINKQKLFNSGYNLNCDKFLL
jgi:NTE family protein